MAYRNIRNNKENNTILRKQAKKVENIDNKVLTLLEDMADTMYQEEGVGLAAPQGDGRVLKCARYIRRSGSASKSTY